ncbi:hypothetical protein BCV69DRAFT_285843 [Microstroma glucosiphilum]|uniref:Uncharacterized protein n=1 Tax=Pseudomicrostroma glucosiphilum TaxID=1684307 RepID=A0A316TY27_9BASI|nr:hypothetical protein BCV69DRAFT_285843 [Pseudomicrostroma glucosiphilum]PWN17654.1 hypothetical protein BCV69DRAFT_285843 [Pseudomicrostroma glucosiphilum]
MAASRQQHPWSSAADEESDPGGEPACTSRSPSERQSGCCPQPTMQRDEDRPYCQDKTLDETDEKQLPSNIAFSNHADLAKAPKEGDICGTLDEILKACTTPFNKATWHDRMKDLEEHMHRIGVEEGLPLGGAAYLKHFLEELDQRLAATVCSIFGEAAHDDRLHNLAQESGRFGHKLLRILEKRLQPEGSWEELYLLWRLKELALSQGKVDDAIGRIEALAFHASQIGASHLGNTQVLRPPQYDWQAAKVPLRMGASTDIIMQQLGHRLSDALLGRANLQPGRNASTSTALRASTPVLKCALASASENLAHPHELPFFLHSVHCTKSRAGRFPELLA